jgi:small GTP-binding protein
MATSNFTEDEITKEQSMDCLHEGDLSREDRFTRLMSLDCTSGGDIVRPYVLRSSASGGHEALVTFSPREEIPLRHNHDSPIVVSTQQQSCSRATPSLPNNNKNYEYTLKFLLVGDSDVGKDEILSGLDADSSSETNPESEESLYGVTFKSTVILLDGKRIRLQVWDTSGGQGRFSTIIRSYSRGAQGILLVYDITNKWSFSGLNRWLNEVSQDAPGIPKILLGTQK